MLKIFKPYREGMGPQFRLRMFDDDSYEFSFRKHRRAAWTPIFEGDDFKRPPAGSTDRAAMKSLMTFLTLRKGDTDREYFESYTKAQWWFSDNHAEAVAYEVYCRFGE